MRVSLSPVPFAGSVGSGAHQHFSLRNPDGPLFSGGDGAHGMTAAGESAVAGLLAGLPDAQGVLSGSILSGLRIAPGMWSGAYVCWGTDNREAAVRFVPSGPSNPHGANAEVKIVDPSANPYFATAAILGLALSGIERQAVLGPETTVVPASLSDEQRAEAGIRLLPANQGDALDALARSSDMRAILGDEAVDTIVAVRRYEQENFAGLTAAELAEKFRLAWSV
jgi:glutamine synthetase